MKINSTSQSVTGRWHDSRLLTRLLGVFGVVALCVAALPSANAQSRAGDLSTGSLENGLFNHANGSYRVVSPAAFRTAADVGTTQPGDISQVVFGSDCDSCGTACGGGCGGSACGSCGTSCGGACGGYSACSSCGMSCAGACRNQFINPCAPCAPYVYGLVEGLYMKRDDKSSFSVSSNFFLRDFDYEGGGRITVGYVPNCTQGCEVSYTGQPRWRSLVALSDPAGGLNTTLLPGAGFGLGNFSAFNNANLQIQTYTTDFWSVEINEACVGWDIIKLIRGIRYIDLEEQFNYFSRTNTEVGLLVSDIKNRLVGYQVGMDLLFPVCQRVYTDMRARAGLYANFAESSVVVSNAGALQVAARNDKTDIAAMFELGSGLRYRFNEMLSLRGGIEVWYLTGIGEASSQFGNVIFTGTGRRTRLSDDIFLFGASLGAELKY